MICDSIKVKDPMKVGRFGLGFKSVFHMTGKLIFIQCTFRLSAEVYTLNLLRCWHEGRI